MKSFNLKFIIILFVFGTNLNGQIISDPELKLNFKGDVETAVIDGQVLKSIDIQSLNSLISIEKRFPYKRYYFNRIGLLNKLVTHKTSSDSITTKFVYDDNIISQKNIYDKQQNLVKTINYTYRHFTRKLIFNDGKGYTKSVANYDNAGRIIKLKFKNLVTKQKNIAKTKYKDDRKVKRIIISNRTRIKQFFEYDEVSGKVIQMREYSASLKPHKIIEYKYTNDKSTERKIINLLTKQIDFEMIETLKDEFGNEIFVAVKINNKVYQFIRTDFAYYNSAKE